MEPYLTQPIDLHNVHQNPFQQAMNSPLKRRRSQAFWSSGDHSPLTKGSLAILLQSGLQENVRLNPWNVTAIHEMFKISFRARKLHVKGVLENHFVGQLFFLRSMVEISPDVCERSGKTPPVG